MTWLEFFKTFAGPIATVIASATGAAVAIGFGFVQARIARSQAEIAFDKLKNDLFEKRYNVYLAATRVIEAAMKQSPGGFADLELTKLHLKLGEARFFFPPDTRAFCENISTQAAYLVWMNGHSEDDPDGFRVQKSEIIWALSDIYVNLPKQFERDLGFEQLIKPVRRQPRCGNRLPKSNHTDRRGFSDHRAAFC